MYKDAEESNRGLKYKDTWQYLDVLVLGLMNLLLHSYISAASTPLSQKTASKIRQFSVMLQKLNIYVSVL